MKSLACVLAAALLVLVGCAPSGPPAHDGGGDDDDIDGGGGGFIDASEVGGGGKGTISGTVWAPGQAPGMVPAGQEIPIAGAVVYLAGSSPPAIPDGVYCQTCQDNPNGAVVTNSKGKFELTGVSTGEHLLIIDKAQFRLEQTVEVNEKFGTVLGSADTTLPSVHDPAQGKWIPRVAIAVGDSDHVEDIFGKMRILDVDGSGTTIESSFDDTDRVEIYGNVNDPFLPDDPGPAPFASKHKGTIHDLFGSLTKMKRYHIIFVPCNYQSDVSRLAQPIYRKNVQDYVAAGGHLYVTDWAAEYEDAAFPEFITFDQGGMESTFESSDTTAAMAAANNINLGDGDFGHFAPHGRAEDPGLREWLHGQKGPLITPLGGEELGFPSEYHDGVIDADDFVIEGAWAMIRALPTVNLGNDSMGNPINAKAKVWITGDYTEKDPPLSTGRWPHSVTFEPSCGRVLYSTYHTAEKPHKGLMPQERVLLYLIMELGVCSEQVPIP